MVPQGSISRWIDPLKQGDDEAATVLWHRYFLSLIEVARRRLGQGGGLAADAEDVALSAFASFCRHAEGGRYPQLSSRDGLWRILALITARKAIRVLRDQGRQKRQASGSPGERGWSHDEAILRRVFSREPSPELAAQMTEDYHCLLNKLGDDVLRRVAVLRMEGFSVEEIAAQVDVSPRSVKRKLQLIRTIWEDEAP